MPDSCTHIEGECNGSNGLFIKRHNAAVQLVHAMVRNCAMGGDALHSTPLVLVTCHAGAQPQTSMENVLAMDASAASDYDNELEDEDPSGSGGAPDPQASGHMPDSPRPRVPHCLDLKDAQAVQADVEGIEAPRFIPVWILSESATRLLEQLSKLAAQRLDAILSHRFAEISRLGPVMPPPPPPPPRHTPPLQ